MIARTHYLSLIEKAYQIHPIAILLGPRQVGKTTLAKTFTEMSDREKHYYDMEDPDDANAFEHPKLALKGKKGLIVIDEVQRVPQIFTYLRVFVDQNPEVQILLLGSAAPRLLIEASESLTGRMATIEITPFSLKDSLDLQQLWEKGGYPRSFLAKTLEGSFEWRRAYIQTFLERDLPALGATLSPLLLRRLWTIVADYHAQISNFSEIGRAIDLSQGTIKKYLDLLEGTFMLRSLPPWFENITKRQVKAPKIYVRDAGLLHALLSISTGDQLLGSRKLGSSWEGFAIEQVIAILGARQEECFFWATHSGAEVDLLIVKDGKKYAFEFKYSSQPKTTKSMHEAIATLELPRLYVIVPGSAQYSLSDQIEVWGLERVCADMIGA